MKSSRLIPAVVFAFPLLCGAASKEIVELQRDVAQLQDQIRTLQSAFDTKMTLLTAQAQQAADSATRTSTALAGLQGAIQEQLREQTKQIAGPVANLNAKIDEMTTAFQQVQNGMADVTSRLGNIEQQMKDLSNQMRTICTPAAAPPSAGGTTPSPGASSIPPVDGKTLYANADRDRLGGKNDLALQEYQQYVKYFGDGPFAPNAQFWIGYIYYTQTDYEDALKAFDDVLVRFSPNSKTPDAYLWKGTTLVKLGQRTAGAKELRQLIKLYPSSEASTKARAQLKQLGLPVSSAPARKR
ncbi:MAG TPA: tetratricopeptide repeat protein [Bryobacteraceae bacterium]|nr:tetratricopeptide repeat protein [Bryobacteraceae bacterium]